MDSKTIRQTFLDFFNSKQHQIVPSAPIVLKDDPTLMFTNSGMNQFKDFFLGYKNPDYKRTADTQKCLRVSGKHNDLDDVGKDTYHHTMFEMLGNWSFGDYFKKEAIDWAWELLTEVYKIPKDRIYVTIFEGDKKDGLEKDTDAYNYWKSHISEDRILNGNKKDNFWEMGEVGPCGPCSEIHLDLRSDVERQKTDAKLLVNHDDPQVVEIWNLVFMEYERKADGSLVPLPNKNIDTGMGFERLCMALQGKTSNYDTDVFTPLIKKVEDISGFKYGENKDKDIAIRVIVDHIRAVAFAIADGQIPSNTGAGYVIRRILRRAITYGFRFLNLKTPFLYQLVDILNEQMKDFFPEINSQSKLIKEVIKEEENSFLKTIEQGLNRLDLIINQLKKENQAQIPGKILFELYDTYGFPLDLSRIIGEEEGFSIDEKGFEEEMSVQKQRGKAVGQTKYDDWELILENEPENFIGYDALEAPIKISRVRKVQNKDGEFYQLVFNQTPFYAESGGQIGDIGQLKSKDEVIDIIDTKKENNLIIHLAKQKPKNLNAEFTATVNKERRTDIMRNHTATHLLHQALREKLGKHVEQKGSFVGPNNLRFDFSHFNKLSPEDITWIEHFVNDKIQANIRLEENRDVPIQEAIDKGAMALFGEKYGDKVRTIQYGDSIELCGGTHVPQTSDIFYFKLLSESSIASGIRRIEAITGNKVRETFEKQDRLLTEINELVGNQDIKQSIQKLMTENQELKKQIDEFLREKALNEKSVWKNKIIKKDGINYLVIETNINPNSIKDILFQLQGEVDNLIAFIATTYENKPNLTLSIAKNLVDEKSLDASPLIRELAKEIQGGGGGQPFFATAGGKNLDGLQKSVNQFKEKFGV